MREVKTIEFKTSKGDHVCGDFSIRALNIV